MACSARAESRIAGYRIEADFIVQVQTSGSEVQTAANPGSERRDSDGRKDLSAQNAHGKANGRRHSAPLPSGRTNRRPRALPSPVTMGVSTPLSRFSVPTNPSVSDAE